MTPFQQSFLLFGCSIVTGLFTTWFWSYQKKKSDRLVSQALIRKEEAEILAVANQKLMDRVVELEAQTRLLGQQVLPIWTASQAILIKELTHFHTPIMDKLLLKLGPPFILTESEEVQLNECLVERTKDMSAEISDSERNAAHLLPLLIPRARSESEAMLNIRMVILPMESSSTMKDR